MRIHYPKLRNMAYTLFECFHCFQRNKLLYFNLNMKIYKEDCSTDIKKNLQKSEMTIVTIFLYNQSCINFLYPGVCLPQLRDYMQD